MTVQGDNSPMRSFGSALLSGIRIAQPQIGFHTPRMKGRLRSFSTQGLDAHRQGVRVASEKRRTLADTWALSLVPIIRDVVSDGYLGLADLAKKLEVRGCATRRGGQWTPVRAGELVRRLVRLGELQHPKLSGRSYHVRTIPDRDGVERTRQAIRSRADAFARALSPILDEIRCSGQSSYAQIAKALNARKIKTRQQGRWTVPSVKNLCIRLNDMSADGRLADISATEMFYKS